jgi:3'-5' exoribonuclease
MEMITKEQLQKLTAGQQISGIILVKSYNIQLTKGGKEYIAGSLQSGVDVPFKAWGNSSAFPKFKGEAYENVPSYIVGSVDGFGGTNTIIIDSVQAVDGYTPDQFFPIKYDIEAYWGALKNQIAKRVSEKGQAICNSILFNNEELSLRFKQEFAAMSHHDNCKGGLLAHTYKVINNIATIINLYPNIVVRNGAIDKDYVDLLYIGTLLHDIGKTVEMNFGVYQPKSIVTHNYLGIEFIAPYKEEIVKSYSEEWYYNLISILLQHHGEYEAPCRTVAAFVVHKADEFDATLTLLSQTMESVNNEAGSRVKVEDRYLTI